MNKEQTSTTTDLDKACTRQVIVILVGKLAVIGCGSIGEELVKSLTQKNYSNIIATRRDCAKLGLLKAQYQIDVDTDNLQAATAANTIVLAVKPVYLKEVSTQIKAAAKDKLVISMAAKTSLDELASYFDASTTLARVMTGVNVAKETAWYAHKQTDATIDQRIKFLFGSDALRVDEAYLAHRTVAACDTGLVAEYLGRQIGSLSQDNGLATQDIQTVYANMLRSVANALDQGRSGQEIALSVGANGSYTRSLIEQIEEQGFYDLMQGLVNTTVKKLQ